MAIIITLTGDLGSGKTTVAEYIEKNFGFEIYSTGKVQRKIADRLNMTTFELNEYSKSHPEIDVEIDKCFSDLSKSKDDLIVESRMAWHFLPDSFKVYLKVNTDIGAERIYNDERGKTEKYKSIEEAKMYIIQRKQKEVDRFLETYKVNCADLKNYDFIIDSTEKGPEEVAKTIMSKAIEYFNNRKIDSKKNSKDNSMEIGLL